jgi:predicted CoA-binding protein
MYQEVPPMTTTRNIQDFLALHRIAMVGVSRDANDFSRKLFREMCNRGYDMVPVNRMATEIDGRECFQCLQAVRPAVEGVLVMTPAYESIRVVWDCAETGINKVWIYRASGTGAASDNAVAFCKQNAIQMVDGCPLMFFPRAGFVHRAHGLLLKIMHRYPAAA